MSDAPGVLDVLREPATIRARCAAITRSVEDDCSPYFRLDPAALDGAAERVARLIRTRFPDLQVPFHSRWRHFEAGGTDRKAELDALLDGRSPAEQARARFDLTVVSVLLDAGAGPQWRYREQHGVRDVFARPGGSADVLALAGVGGAAAGAPRHAAAGAEPGVYARSEGLGVASFRAFVAGAFSASPGDALRADASALRRIDASMLATLFQAGPGNPLVGLEGRAGLLQRLGEALGAEAARGGFEPRPGLLYDLLTERGTRSTVDAGELLRTLLHRLGPVWRSGTQVQGQPAGDVWMHRWAGDATDVAGRTPPHRLSTGWVPFHKLSQWLAYSLLEPLQWAGVQLTGLDTLTGLPEYRNGGLLIDAGVILPRDPRDLQQRWKAGDEFVIEWRALTVTLLDRLADAVRAQLGVSAAQLPLACILEGGSWAAGREIAAEKRPGGAPPLTIDSDGTVF